MVLAMPTNHANPAHYGRNLTTQKFETYCEHCNTAWPCPTIEALRPEALETKP